jgi:hypothetical protein
MHRRPRLVDHLPGDEHEQRDGRERCGQREPVERGVTRVEAPAPPELGGAGGRRLGDGGQA